MRQSARCALALLAATLAAGCSPSLPPAPGDATNPQTQTSASASLVLGSPAWYAWVDRTLGISEDGHGPDQGSDEWNQAVQRKLGQEAPQLKPGTPQWQQAVDSLLRTRPTTP